VVGDSAQLQLLFHHLLSNSLRYRKPGVPPRIEISAERLWSAEWRFCVRDSGLGFDPAHSTGMFAPFRRLHGREISGTGLGLTLCRRIVERHGGRIWAEGVAGKGAAFCFTLPAVTG
jgi:light-regulated signal transduction histidine kinase (bacteriophytochrome)